ncbi:N-acetyl sugar amidotransferase [Fusobacterium ulcerans]|uniref:N-acetyl sugar amidotransferase n=1 Tax=Fusobacterium ulcerans TaxID=861 RepID=UPI00241E02D2|nr:N-acetyl sugar amidotransferase [Fusobacterium ulcerans]
MIKYCKKCLFPSTKPNLEFNEEGVCTACSNFQNRKEINWKERKEELIKILNKYKSKNENNWDCIVPVSGGKDSTYQIIKVLELGMNPLCVTATTCKLTEIGRKNIENLKNLGVDYIEFTANPKIRKKLNKISLIEIGDISYPEHLSIFTMPVKAAVYYKVPLIIWGENSQNEYGGPAAASKNNILDKKWLDTYGGLLGLDIQSLVGKYDIEKKDIIPYTYPTDRELKDVGVTGIFLGHYIPWDGLTNKIIASAYGFQDYGQHIEGALESYENLDNYYNGIHEYFKFLKLGFSRATDQASLHIRRNRLTREDGVKIVKILDGKFPWSYLGKPLEEILNEIEMTLEEFINICDKFTNKSLFRCDENGNLIKDKNGNLEKINYDNVNKN